MENETYGVTLELVTNKFKNELKKVKGTLKEFKGNVKENLQNFEIGFKSGEIEESYRKIQDNIKKSTNVDFIKRQQEQLTLLEKRVDQSSNSIFRLFGEKLRSGIDKVKDAWIEARKPIEDVNEQIEKTKQKEDEATVKSNNLGNSIANAMKKSTNNIKKFVLSLFGLRSIWATISRATSAYMSQDKQLSEQISKTWASLGAMLAPIIEKLVQGFRTVISYVNYFVKALTGKDLIAKATKKIKSYNKVLNGTTKAAKAANKELTSLDEVTNLSFDDDSTSGIADAIGDIENPFDDFKDIKLDPKITKFLDDAAKACKEIGEKVKPIIDWAIQHPDALLKILGGAALFTTLTKLTGGVGGGMLGALGLSLSNLAAIGVITVGIMIIGDSIAKINKANKELQGLIKNNNEASESNKKITNDLIKANKEHQKSVKGVDNTTIKYNDTLLNSNKRKTEQVKTIHNQYNWITKLNGSYKDLDKELYNLINTEISQTNELKRNYNEGKLTESQAKEYKNTLKEQISTYSELASKTKAGTYENEIYNLRIKELIGNLKEINGKKYEPKLIVNDTQAKEKTDTLSGKLNKLAKEKFGVDIDIGVKSKTAKTKISEFFAGVNKFTLGISGLFGGIFKGTTAGTIANLLSKIPSFDIGTNYIPNDMVAQVHKGEMIVPAKYNPATSGIGTNNAETNALLLELNRNVLELADKPTILRVNGRDLAQATYKDYQNEGNRLNTSVSISIK